MYGNTEGSELRLITCDGYDPFTGAFDDYYVVYAKLVPWPIRPGVNFPSVKHRGELSTHEDYRAPRSGFVTEWDKKLNITKSYSDVGINCRYSHNSLLSSATVLGSSAPSHGRGVWAYFKLRSWSPLKLP